MQTVYSIASFLYFFSKPHLFVSLTVDGPFYLWNMCMSISTYLQQFLFDLARLLKKNSIFAYRSTHIPQGNNPQGEGVLPYITHRYVSHQRRWFLGLFGLKKGNLYISPILVQPVPGVQIAERGRKIQEEKIRKKEKGKKRPPPPPSRFPGVRFSLPTDRRALLFERPEQGDFGLESRMVFEVTTGVYERIYRFNSK